ncbi:leucine-rich repeat-containing protein 31 [Salarias fasciatus]|uniref:leucine-rich repeat-containing protein 31 n=1 Tax=Salarias fasciatus TaxID=181472 RepID=UPI001176C505|nr:leucine-rich repeat-containing protein 31 [Salarias fasciatus]
MESADGARGRRSPLDVIMSQIRRKRSAPDRKPSGRSLSRSGIPEDGGVCADPDLHVGWGQVCVFLQKLGKTADSRSLSVSHCDLTATELLELALLLQFLPQLEDLDLSWNELIGGCLTALTSHLHHVGGVRTLRLSSCRLNAADVSALAESLAGVPFLEVLSLSWNSGVGGGALHGLLDKLHPPLRELHLVACQLTAADAAALGRTLTSLPRLSLLDVSCNPQLATESSPDPLRELCSVLAHSAALEVLRLQDCGLSGEQLPALGGALRGVPLLRELDLSRNKRLTGALGTLTSHLALLSHLESLDLHLCSLTQDDLQALIQVLPALSALSELDVSSNQEAGGVVNPLVSALTLEQMRRLPLNNCSLNEESFTALTLVVPSLLALDLSWNKVVGGRLPLLLDALQPSVLLELRLSSCDLSTDDLQHLAVACRRGCLSSLRLLDLSYNGAPGGAGWAAVFSAGGLGSLEDLDVSLRPSTWAPCSAWLAPLLAALPEMPALARLAARRWTAGTEERRRLLDGLKRRSVLLEWDPDRTEPKGGGEGRAEE